jgi:exopolysaccharide production protein ExoZ
MNNFTVPEKLVPDNKYDSTQVFRLVAAFMVIILHSTFYASERLGIKIPLYEQGTNGVRLFFVISGFVMIISSEKLKIKAGGWKVFAIKRIIRIVPIYWIITTFKLFILIFASSVVYHSKLDIIYILKSYFFIPAMNVDGKFTPLVGVGWTLNFEMFFYLLFTIALAFRLNTILFLSMIFIPLAILYNFNNPSWPDIRFYANPIVLDFLYGMIAGQLILKNKKLPPKIGVAFIGIGLLYLFLPQLAAQNLLENLLIGIAAFLVIYGGASIENLWMSKPGWLIYLGGASYSLYLVHPLIAPLSPSLLSMLKLRWVLLSIILSIVFAIAAGTIFYKFCEKPISLFLSKLAKKCKLI